MVVVLLYPCCPHSLDFLSLCPVSMLSWGQKIKVREQGEMSSRVTKLTSLVGWWAFLLHLGHVSHPYFQPLPWDLLAMVVATMQAWVLESQPQ